MRNILLMALPRRNRRRGAKGQKKGDEVIHCPPSWDYPTPSGLTTTTTLNSHCCTVLRPEGRRPPINGVYVAPAVHERLSVISDVIEPRVTHTLQNVRIFSQNGVLISGENEIISDLSPDFKPRQTHEHRLLRYTGLPRPKRLEGNGFSFVSAASWKNYFHWLVDTLPTARFINWDDYDYILAPNCRRYHELSYEALGIPSEKIIPLEHETHYEVEQLSHIPRGGVALVPDEAVQYLRDLFGVAPCPHPSRKLYLSRNDGWRRRITNEDEVLSALEPYGYEHVVIGKRSIKEQAELFSQASHVVGPHGAAMTNLVFSGRQTKLMECFSGTFMFPHFYHLCATLGQPYLAHWTENPTDAPDGPIDLESFLPLIEQMD